MTRKVENGVDLTRGIFPESPWLHEEVVQWLDGRVTDQSRILEIGAGGSTVWFARRTPYVTSIEHNAQWFEATCNYLNEQNLPGTVLYRPNYPTEGFAFDEQFDLVLVDGEGYTRSLQIHYAIPLVKPGGWLVLDDAQRPQFTEGIKQAAHKSRFTIEFVDSKFKEKTIAWHF